jgi:hypothetical protein
VALQAVMVVGLHRSPSSRHSGTPEILQVVDASAHDPAPPLPPGAATPVEWGLFRRSSIGSVWILP